MNKGCPAERPRLNLLGRTAPSTRRASKGGKIGARLGELFQIQAFARAHETCLMGAVSWAPGEPGGESPVQALPGNELLRDLPLELNAVGTLSGHGFHPLKAQLTLSNH